MKGCKYTVLGASVFILDESAGPIILEQNRVPFVRQLADSDYGVGCSAMAFLRSTDLSTLTSGDGPVSSESVEQLVQLLQEQNILEATIVRTFLPSGHELSLSGTTLCAVADYFYQIDGRRELWLISGVPASSPSLHYVYRDLTAPLYNAAIGQPVRLPEQVISHLYSRLATSIPDSTAVEVLHPVISLPSGAWPFTLYTVYVGEPYLVCFVGKLVPAEDQSDLLADIFEQPAALQAALLERIVTYLNGYPDILSSVVYPGATLTPPTVIFNPELGINVVFARLTGDGTMDARFYRRGTYREVRLSGTGAVAAAVVAHHLGLLPRPCAEVRGWLNIAEGRYEAVIVKRSGEAWWLEAPAERIWSGELM